MKPPPLPLLVGLGVLQMALLLLPASAIDAPKTCSPKQFACKDQITCISKGWRCDGEKDCPDGSDESPDICPQSKVSKCQPNEQSCLSTETCLYMSKLCDGTPDCPDSSDEGAHCREFAANCTHAGCQHQCVPTLSGPACYCNSTFQLREDGKSCKDFDECTLYGTCSQTCTNTEGSYTCSCVEGYLLQPDNRSCKAKNEPVDRMTVLLIANSQNILATSLTGAQVPNITPTSTRQTTAMDFNYAEETVCWVHVGDSASQTVLKCARIPNLKGFVEERTINISLSLHLLSSSLQIQYFGICQPADTIYKPVLFLKYQPSKLSSVICQLCRQDGILDLEQGTKGRVVERRIPPFQTHSLLSSQERPNCTIVRRQGGNTHTHPSPCMYMCSASARANP